MMSNVLESLDRDNGFRKRDLKPQNFSEPVRDLVPDDMKTKLAKSGLTDQFDEEVALEKTN